MPRGTKEGSSFHEDALVEAETGRVLRPERWIVRRRYTDLKGREREKKRIAYTASEVVRARRKIDREIEDELAGLTKPDRRRTVSKVIEHCKQRHFKPPVYSGDTKIAGQRTWRATCNALKPIEKYFGSMAIAEVTHDDLHDYLEERMRTAIIRKRVRFERRNGKKVRVEYAESRPRKIASVDRELAWFRRVLSIALSKRWITEHPFRGDTLIETAREEKHDRILSFEEQQRLFSALAKEPKRSHLPFAVTMALETGMRKGEQFRLNRTTDVDLERRILTALSYKGKKAVRRYVPITEHLLKELTAHLAATSGVNVFDFADPKKAFANACVDAGIEGVTWHTLRHTAITRMVHVYKLPPIDVMKISGHTVWKTFFETYVNITEDMVRAIGAQIDAARAAAPPVSVSDPFEGATEAIN